MRSPGPRAPSAPAVASRSCQRASGQRKCRDLPASLCPRPPPAPRHDHAAPPRGPEGDGLGARVFAALHRGGELEAQPPPASSSPLGLTTSPGGNALLGAGHGSSDPSTSPVLPFSDRKKSFLDGPAVLSFKALHDLAPVRLAHLPFPGRATLAGSQFLSFTGDPHLLILTSGLR